MAIPPFSADRVIPPFVGDPTQPGSRSPHLASSLEVVTFLATSLPRCTLLGGWLRYRAALYALGMVGFQWIDGSFCEDLEPPREPSDIDLLNFWALSATIDRAEFDRQMKARTDLHPGEAGAKATYKCDVYYEKLTGPGSARIDGVHYWYGLFSHRKKDNAWKGLLKVLLPASPTDDIAATNALHNIIASLKNPATKP